MSLIVYDAVYKVYSRKPRVNRKLNTQWFEKVALANIWQYWKIPNNREETLRWQTAAGEGTGTLVGYFYRTDYKAVYVKMYNLIAHPLYLHVLMLVFILCYSGGYLRIVWRSRIGKPGSDRRKTPAKTQESCHRCADSEFLDQANIGSTGSRRRQQRGAYPKPPGYSREHGIWTQLCWFPAWITQEPGPRENSETRRTVCLWQGKLGLAKRWFGKMTHVLIKLIMDSTWNN